ncbi:hypothetical protein ARZXY2_4720 (plasmid) [Arthrobacter sp. ZXY-2]|nr:hypothetical protein ARZXY2_4720 [Arthrobacter sp. ZXY-2]
MTVSSPILRAAKAQQLQGQNRVYAATADEKVFSCFSRHDPARTRTVTVRGPSNP